MGPQGDPGPAGISPQELDEILARLDSLEQAACIDIDGDGFGSGPGCFGPDCEDNNSGIYPAALEICDGVDNNCDGRVDEVCSTSGRFIDVGDGTVQDNFTGLIWLKDVTVLTSIMTWNMASQRIAILADGQLGLSDGSQPGDRRIPTSEEIRSLRDTDMDGDGLYYNQPDMCNTEGTGPHQEGDPFIGLAYGFPPSRIASYWTSDECIDSGNSGAYVVSTYYLVDFIYHYCWNKTFEKGGIWPVRDPF